MKEEYKKFETERLFIKPTTVEDASFIFQLLNSPKWLKYIGDRNINSIDSAAEYIKMKMIPQLKKLGYSNYTVIKKSDETKIGVCSLYNREGLEGIDIGFALLPQFEKNGFAFESTRKIIEVAYKVFKIKDIVAITIKENIESQNLLRKIGFKFKKIIKLPNDLEDLLLYKLEKNFITEFH
jgi:RimJ/RimL family protein N-acetyltransferase